MKYITPILKLNTDLADVNIYVKRDDLLPFSFGGNKVRIAAEYYSDMKSRGKNCMIGYGNARSNLCRVLANMSIAENVPCYIISAADDDGKTIQTNNSKIVESCNAVFRYCLKENVAETVQSVMDECSRAGFNPYYIYGDIYGKGNESVPVEAYVKAYREIEEQSKDMKINFDYIFCATGTGMTQAGLIVGKQLYNGSEDIIGISAARPKEKETGVIRGYVDEYMRSKKIVCEVDKINVMDDYLCGGYGKYNTEIINTIKEMLRTNGLPLDPTYTGKAFYGMEDFIKRSNIRNANVLFIHTGGTPLFFDNIGLMTDNG